jgi:predicted RND superfamily exporter protein
MKQSPLTDERPASPDALAAGPAARPAAAGWLALSICGLLVMVVSTPLIAWSAFSVLESPSQTPMEWVRPEFPQRRDYDRFKEIFGSGDVVIATWDGCTVDSPAVDRVVAAAAGPGAPTDAQGRAWFDSVSSGSSVVARLTAPPLELDRDTAIDRLEGFLIGPDRRTTCVVFAMTPAGITDRRRAVPWIRDLVRQTATTDDASIHLAGPVVDHATVDVASKESLQRFAPAAAAIVLVLTWWSLRSFRYALIVFAIALWCVGLSFTTLHLFGDRMNAVLIVMPALVLVLGVSGGIHLVNYLVEASNARGQAGGAGVAARAVRLGWTPCLLSAGTTAVGLASLVVSELEPIRTFGCHAAIAVMATLLVTFAVLPGLFERYPIAPQAVGDIVTLTPPYWQSVAKAVVRWATPVVIAFFAVMAVTAVGVPHIRTSIRIDTIFSPTSRLIRDYAAIERSIGPLVPIEVVLGFGPDCELRPDRRLTLVEKVGERLRETTGAATVMSAASFAPQADAGAVFRSRVRQAATSRRLAADLAAIDDIRYVRNVDDRQLWRLTARISALDDIDYGRLLGKVESEVAPVVAEAGGEAAGITAGFTGVMPVIHGVQNTLLNDLFSSFVSACLIITLMMMVVQRGFAAGLVSMVSNVFPMLLLFGFLGWARLPLDIGSVMTASIALGMAIDGTLHFLTFYRRAVDAGQDPRAAVDGAFEHSAGALAQSSVVCALGILVFGLSTFAPTSRFAVMLALLVAAALAGDLVLLPAMLVGPLGRCFRPSRRAAPAAEA